MLRDCEAFSTFSTHDVNKAREFYGEILGLDTSEHEMGLLELHLVNSSVLIYPKQDHIPAGFTVLNFKVKNIEEYVDQLIDKGVKFEQYDGPIKTDSKGIHRNENGPAIAWFKDPGGNILSVIEEK